MPVKATDARWGVLRRLTHTPSKQDSWHQPAFPELEAWRLYNFLVKILLFGVIKYPWAALIYAP